jgi:RNA polymerase sigma-70 factor (ECF subfamily)
MSGAEVSQALHISEVDVRVALHRARTQIKAWLGTVADHGTSEAFHFAGERCDRIVGTVFAELAFEAGRE